MASGTLYLIPNALGSNQFDLIFPPKNLEIIRSLDTFIVERAKSTRAFLKRCEHPIPIHEINLLELPRDNQKVDFFEWMEPMFKGKSFGLISEAGLPAIADPGENIVAYAQSMNIPVKPLVGPNSMLMALMASGLNGESFAFNGYLPIDKKERIRKIKQIESVSKQHKQSQVFMETPYRNVSLFEEILKSCHASSKLCVAKNITLQDEWIKTLTIGEWRNQKPNIHKQPCVFILEA